MPGLIDTHIHASQFPNAGLALDLTLLDWLERWGFRWGGQLDHRQVHISNWSRSQLHEQSQSSVQVYIDLQSKVKNLKLFKSSAKDFNLWRTNLDSDAMPILQPMCEVDTGLRNNHGLLLCNYPHRVHTGNFFWFFCFFTNWVHSGLSLKLNFFHSVFYFLSGLPQSVFTRFLARFVLR